MHNLFSLNELKVGQSASVVQIRGGHGIQRRLQSLGIRPGVIVRKVSAAFGPGPVVIAFSRGQAALGYGVARKVILGGGETA